MPMRRELYPPEWPEISRKIRERAGNRCEWPGCGIENGTVVQGKRGPYKIVLTVAHLDHDSHNNVETNLAAWCPRHHLAWDLEQHKQNAAETRRQRKIKSGQLVLFDDQIEHEV